MFFLPARALPSDLALSLSLSSLKQVLGFAFGQQVFSCWIYSTTDTLKVNIIFLLYIFLFYINRRQACLNAVRNCRTKALSIAQYLNQTLGPALTVREEKTLEFTGNSPSQEPNTHHDVGNTRRTSVLNSGHATNVCNAVRTSIQQRIADGTVTVHVQIYAEFECKERTRKSNGCK